MYYNISTYKLIELKNSVTQRDTEKHRDTQTKKPCLAYKGFPDFLNLILCLSLKLRDTAS